MELGAAVRRRRMVRSYDPSRPVSEADLDRCVQAALRAPSAGFTQGVSLLVLTSPTDRELFWEVTRAGTGRWARGMRTAPALVAVWTSELAYLDRYAEPDKGWSDRDPGRWPAPFWFVDGGMAAMSMLLTAVDLGLGACFFGLPADRVEDVRAVFRVPPEQLSVGVVSLGYAAGEGSAGSAAARPRRPTGELVHRGRW